MGSPTYYTTADERKMNFLGKKLTPYKDVFIVAELSCNHEGSLNQALQLIEAAKDSGADAVKIQAYTPDEMTLNCDEDDFNAKVWNDLCLWELYSKTQTPLEWLPELFAKAEQLNIPMFSSVFGEKSLAALEAVDCPVYKIASFEVNDTNLLSKVVITGKPIVLSLGVATENEIIRAVEICGYDSILMHCVSEYPTKFVNLNFSRIRDLDYPIHGFSDHTLTSIASQIAISMGVTIIEKHICLTGTCEDASFSLRPYEFKTFVNDCRRTAEMFNNFPAKNTFIGMTYKRSLYVVKDIKQGEELTVENIKSIRPGFGLDPDLLPDVLGRTAKRDLEAGTALKGDMYYD